MICVHKLEPPAPPSFFFCSFEIFFSQLSFSYSFTSVITFTLVGSQKPAITPRQRILRLLRTLPSKTSETLLTFSCRERNRHALTNVHTHTFQPCRKKQLGDKQSGNESQSKWWRGKGDECEWVWANNRTWCGCFVKNDLFPLKDRRASVKPTMRVVGWGERNRTNESEENAYVFNVKAIRLSALNGWKAGTYRKYMLKKNVECKSH